MRLRFVGFAAAFLIFSAMTAFAEGPTVTLSNSALHVTGTFYESSVSLADNSGNLVVIDEGYTVTAVATTTNLSNFLRTTKTVTTPSTRVTVIRAGGVVNSVEYATDIDVLGAGTKAVYATIDAGRTRTLVAILTDQPLPTSASSFPSFALTERADVRRTGPDTISVVDPPVQPTSTGTVATRTAKIISFNGTAFAVANQANIP